MTSSPLDAGALSRYPLPDPEVQGDKESRGSLLVVAGGGGVPGAPLLTGLAALRVGAGKLTLAAPRLTVAALGVAVPEALIVLVPAVSSGEISPRAVNALRPAMAYCGAGVVGPGMLDAPGAGLLAHDLLAADGQRPWVIDAAALPNLSQAEAFSSIAKGRAVLTPHAGEAASMLGCSKAEVLASPAKVALHAAARFQAIMVLKGATTYVATPSTEIWRHDGGAVGLGTSGSGDVLAGVIGGLMARGASPLGAALWGVRLHGQAGERLTREIGPLGFLASDLLPVLPKVLAAHA